MDGIIGSLHSPTVPAAVAMPVTTAPQTVISPSCQPESDITLDQRSISSTGKIAFTEKLAQLEITDSQVPPYLIQSISNFCQTVFDLELPLYQSEMLTLLKLTQELASFCETANPAIPDKYTSMVVR